MTILEEIVVYKKQETEKRKRLYPLELLQQNIYYASPCVSLKHYLLREDKVGIIAEFKRKSPSKGLINGQAEVEKTSIGYMQGGASALSILTDNHFFGGSSKDLETARKFNYCPVLRKDFIIDAYQIYEAKSIGADAILLIAGILSKEEIHQFITIAHDLGMEVLLEFYDEAELARYDDLADLTGINNRNLKNFTVNFDHAIQMASKLPAEAIKVAESGIQKTEDILLLRKSGFRGFLIGELFMRELYPETTCRKFIHEVELLSKNNV